MAFSYTLDKGYYRQRVNEGEASMREHSGDRMWHGTEYRTQEEDWQRRYIALGAPKQSAQQLWLGNMRARLLPLTADEIVRCKCSYCQDTGVSTDGRNWNKCSKCGAYALHAPSDPKQFELWPSGLLREVEVYTANLTTSYQEFTAPSVVEAVARTVWDYHADDIVWWVREVRYDRTGELFAVDCGMHYKWDDPDDTWSFTVHVSRRKMFLPAE